MLRPYFFSRPYHRFGWDNKAAKAPAAQKLAFSNFQVPGVGLFLLRSQLKKLKPDGSGWLTYSRRQADAVTGDS
jgi:hypothetical protein